MNLFFIPVYVFVCFWTVVVTMDEEEIQKLAAEENNLTTEERMERNFWR